MQWLHNLCGKAEIWLGDLHTHNKPVYYGIKSLPWFIAFIGLFPFLSLLQRGWVVILGKIVGFIIIISLCVFDCVKAKKKGFPLLRWSWVLVFAFAVTFLFVEPSYTFRRKLSPAKPMPETTDETAQNISTNGLLPKTVTDTNRTAFDVYMATNTAFGDYGGVKDSQKLTEDALNIVSIRKGDIILKLVPQNKIFVPTMVVNFFTASINLQYVSTDGIGWLPPTSEFEVSQTDLEPHPSAVFHLIWVATGAPGLHGQAYSVTSLKISTNMPAGYYTARIEVFSDRSDPQEFRIGFSYPP